ncbi:hypothetical protein DNU06_03345 [Putridiphycobacter roseus]|uniref:DUF2480 family protein n=1 Tax=Putridiphycobacter roseus TaxID=2219161 RepID=A0A2W1NVP2_9FLAO|nr:DUF2480 family protein [Putridiphycobacter roseus]PZE18878.1 hypothetical protein DNU06_03345 [Putridiphycobacter roseus]
MEMPIVNKIEKANIQQIDLIDFVAKSPILIFDLKPGLWQEMVIKEKEFRTFVKEINWEEFKGKTVGITCSVDAIIPAWAFMLVSVALKKVDANIYYGSQKEVEAELFFDNLKNMDLTDLKDQRVMVKGCSNIPNPTKAYIELTNLLVPHVKSLMFGEPCSAVPVFKNK